jgi:hypothetical protein
VLDRRQEAVAVLRLDASRAASQRGEVAVLLVERAPSGGWVNLHDCFRLLPSHASSGGGGGSAGGGGSGQRGEFLWRSERDGHGHLYAAPLEPVAAGAAARLKPGGVACSRPLRRLTVGKCTPKRVEQRREYGVGGGGVILACLARFSFACTRSGLGMHLFVLIFFVKDEEE